MTPMTTAAIVARRTRDGVDDGGEPLWPLTTVARGVVTGVWFRNCWVKAMTSDAGSTPSSLRTRAR